MCCALITGYGLFTTKHYAKGSFLLEYRGIHSLVSDNDDSEEEADDYMFYYSHSNKDYRSVYLLNTNLK